MPETITNAEPVVEEPPCIAPLPVKNSEPVFNGSVCGRLPKTAEPKEAVVTVSASLAEPLTIILKVESIVF